MLLTMRVLDTFEKQFDTTVPPRLFRAPGRVNLIGEHTDYNDGFVLPVAIDRYVMVAARLREDRQVHAFALDLDAWDRFDLDAVGPGEGSQEGNTYLRGMAWVLRELGYPLTGVDLVVSGNVPRGAGLSSSAAFEVVCGYTLLALAGVDIDRKDLALAAQRAENDFVGMRCGIMDQFISCLGEQDRALLIDCRDLTYRAVPIPAQAAVVIVDSHVHRGLVDNEYNLRREQCEAAAAYFDVPALRDVDLETFQECEAELDPLVLSRARHVITENARTLEAAEALVAGDLATFGQLMYASHASLRDDFEVSCHELDVLVEIAREVPGVYGARLTGAGFGGSVVVLAQREAADAVSEAVAAKYPEATGREATVRVCRASPGVMEVF